MSSLLPVCTNTAPGAMAFVGLVHSLEEICHLRDEKRDRPSQKVGVAFKQATTVQGAWDQHDLCFWDTQPPNFHLPEGINGLLKSISENGSS